MCNIFKETVLDGQLCYRADVNKFRQEVDRKKMVTDGLVIVLDYNSNRNTGAGEGKDVDTMGQQSSLQGKYDGDKLDQEAMIYIETIGENFYVNMQF